jgi:predicted phage terminase large subunit-like protein
MAAGRCDRLNILAPPRHGKSILISQFFPAWFLLVHPWRRVLLCSYEAGFAAQWGRKVRDLVIRWGPHFGVSMMGDSKAADRWEIAKHGGGMQTAGRGGAILGKGADLMIFDDLLKNSEEACSPTIREHTWDWIVSTAYSRLEPGAAVLHTAQRWHTDDPTGRFRAHEPGRWKEIELPALAKEGDVLGRKVGEALWPTRYPIAVLEEKRNLSPTWFAAQYQQVPMDIEGGFFKHLERIQVIPAAPTADQFTRRVRFWDLAATEKQAGADPDWTVGTLMGRHKDGSFWILDVRRDRIGPKAVRQLIKQTALMDGRSVPIRIEREGGASGKIAAESIVTDDLAGWPAFAVSPKGGKAERAEPWGAQIEAGNARMVQAEWNKPLLDEHRGFPLGNHDDIVDSCSGCITELTLPVPNVR